MVKKYSIWECSVPSFNAKYDFDDDKIEEIMESEIIASKGLTGSDYIDDLMPNIREIYTEAKKTERLQHNGMEGGMEDILVLAGYDHKRRNEELLDVENLIIEMQEKVAEVNELANQINRKLRYANKWL